MNKEEHQFPDPHFDEGCEKCGGFPGVPCEPPKANKKFFNLCLHDNCIGCKNGTCNGLHMISCPCPKCSPSC